MLLILNSYKDKDKYKYNKGFFYIININFFKNINLCICTTCIGMVIPFFVYDYTLLSASEHLHLKELHMKI